jgi:hypothetical protein
MIACSQWKRNQAKNEKRAALDDRRGLQFSVSRKVSADSY